MDEALELLLAKQQIIEVTSIYARAIDRMDEALLRSVFHAGSVHNHFYQGPSSEPDKSASGDDPGDFVRFAFQVLSAHTHTHHQLGNHIVEFESSSVARSECYFTAFHRMRPLGDPLAGETAFETEMDFFVGGRYIDRFELREGEWKIAERVGMTDWMRIEAPASHGIAGIDQSTVSKRYPDDYLYKQASV
ncbi:nuclear transport factor 2 family protein [Congregibacter sp.]|uniref:nuclear transport factor 2 family protein n=1 Tax=Congregibacter sp. TaxID=2744308 RepID=UPI00385EA45C